MFESAYVSKRFDYHTDNLAEVAAQWHRGLLPVPWVPRTVRVSPRLWLASDAVVGSPDWTWVYKARGLVWIGARPVLLSLEFSKWSETQSEVGVCPRSLSWPVGTDRYRRRVLAALEVISQALCSSTQQVHLPNDLTATTEESRVTALESRVPNPEQSIVDRDTSAEVTAGRRSGSTRRRVLVPLRP
jgi:hypothetical protein